MGHLYVAPADEPNSIRQLTRAAENRLVALTPMVIRLSFFARRMDKNGGSGRATTKETTCGASTPMARGSSMAQVVSPVGRQQNLFSAKDPDGLRQIWKINKDGKPPLQVTATETSASLPSLAPDGTWFVYSTETSVGSGGYGFGSLETADRAEEIRCCLLPTRHRQRFPQTASMLRSELGVQTIMVTINLFLEVIPAEGGAPVIEIDVKASNNGQRWRPDGKALTCRIGPTARCGSSRWTADRPNN